MKYPAYIPFKTTKEQGDFLDTVENRSQYIREAIAFKRNYEARYGTAENIKAGDIPIEDWDSSKIEVNDNEEAIEEKRSIDTYLSDRTTTAGDAKEALNKIFERLDGKRQVQ